LMPLLVRLGQHTLRGFGRYVEPTGAMDSSRRNPQGCMENSNTTDAGDPNGRAGLSNRCC